MITRIAAAALAIGVLAACKPADAGIDPAVPDVPAVPAVPEPSVQPQPDLLPESIRNQQYGPGEDYAECADGEVLNYHPDTSWEKAVEMCGESGRYADRMEAELHRRGFDDLHVGG